MESFLFPATLESLLFGIGVSLSAIALTNYVFLFRCVLSPINFKGCIRRCDIVQKLHSSWAMLCGWIFNHGKGDMTDFDVRVAQVVDKIQVDRARIIARVTVHIFAFITFWNIVCCALAKGDHDYLMRNKLLRNSSLFLLIEACVAFPNFLSVSRIQIIILFIGVRLVITVLIAPDLESLVLISPIINTLSFTHAFFGKSHVVVLVNGVFAAVSIYAFSMLHQDSSSSHAFASSAFNIQFQHNVILTGILSCLVGWYVNHSTRLEVRETLEQRETMNARELTVESLLAVLCDAVVSLDAELNICGPAKKLCALLLLPSLHVRSFLDLMTTSDLERFQSHIGATKPGVHAQSLNVHLKCANGSLVLVRLFQASFQDVEHGNLRYIIGVQELDAQASVDAAVGHNHQLCARSSSSSNEDYCSMAQAPELDAKPSHNEASDTDSLNSSQSAGESEQLKFGSILVDVDVVNPCEVCSITLKIHPSSLNMIDMVNAEAWPAFIKWIQTEFNILSYSDAPSGQNFGSLKMWWPFGNFYMEAKSIKVLGLYDDRQVTIKLKGLKPASKCYRKHIGNQSHRGNPSHNSALSSIKETCRV